VGLDRDALFRIWPDYPECLDFKTVGWNRCQTSLLRAARRRKGCAFAIASAERGRDEIDHAHTNAVDGSRPGARTHTMERLARSTEDDHAGQVR